jgi:hypothetical protein
VKCFAGNADYYDALKRITLYDAPERLKRRAEKDYGLSGDEAVEMAYENVLNEARMAIKGRKRPQSLEQGAGQRAAAGKE